MSELKPEFKEKLLKAKVLTKWKRNFNECYPEAEKDYGYNNNANSFDNFIGMSFVWMNSPEGNDFWLKISNL
jgi:hypothetical protein